MERVAVLATCDFAGTAIMFVRKLRSHAIAMLMPRSSGGTPLTIVAFADDKKRRTGKRDRVKAASWLIGMNFSGTSSLPNFGRAKERVSLVTAFLAPDETDFASSGHAGGRGEPFYRPWQGLRGSRN